MRKISSLLTALCCLLCLQPVTAQNKPKPERVSTANLLGVYWLAGYDNMYKMDRRIQNVGGPFGGMGFAYQLQHGTYSRGAFLFNLGLEAQYGINFRKGAFDLTRRFTYPSEDMFLSYQIRNFKEKQSAFDVSASLMFGGKFKGFFFLAGARLAYPLMAGYSLSSDVNRIIYDAQAIDDYTDMPNHLQTEAKVFGDGKLAKRFNPLLAFELGYDFHKPVQQDNTKGKGRGKQKKWTFKEYGHCQLSAFLNVGVINYKPEHTESFVGFDNGLGVACLQSSSHAEEFAAARTIPLYAGLKFALMFELMSKKQKKEAERNPYIVTFVEDEVTGKALAGATVTTQPPQQGKSKKKPIVKVTDAKFGRVVRSYAPGVYSISASRNGYFPKEPFFFSHEDRDDTLHIALYPQRQLRSQVIDSKTGRAVVARVTVMDESGDTIAQSSLDSVATVLSTLVDDRKQYSVCVTAEGYRDTCTQVNDIAQVQVISLEPIRVKRFVLHNMYFATNKTKILPSSESALQDLYNMLKDNPDIRIRIIGHTDDVGKDDYNQTLSEGRAKSVKKEMVDRGIDAKRIETTGRGEKDPIVPNDSEKHRQMNRRVEIEILHGASVESFNQAE